MNTFEDYGEEELCDVIIQLRIQDSCQDAFLKSAARYEAPFTLQRNQFSDDTADRPVLPLLPAVSLTPATDQNLRVLAAIEQGRLANLQCDGALCLACSCDRRGVDLTSVVS